MLKEIGELASTNMPSMLFEFCWNILKSFVSKKIEEKKLKEKLGSYLSRKLQENQICTLEEELDLEGLINYIYTDFSDEVKLLLCGSPVERRRAEQEIHNYARLYAKAHTKIAEARSDKIITDIINLLRDFYRSQIPDAEKFLTAEVEDSINEHTTNTISSAVESIRENIDTKFDALNKNIQQLHAPLSPIGEGSSHSATASDVQQSHRWFRSDNGEEVRSDQLIVYGNVTAQLDNNIARGEIKLLNGKTMYAEFDIEKNELSNIKLEGFPQKYSIQIADELIISVTEHPLIYQGVTHILKHYNLKFGGSLTAVYDSSQTALLDFQAHAPAGMTTHIDTNIMQICFIKKEDAYM